MNRRRLRLGTLATLVANAGATVRLTLERHGAEHRVTLTLKELL